MKKIFVNFLISGALALAFTACSEDTLVFPPAVEDTDSGEIIDVVARPSDVLIEGDYDYRFRVRWPELSDKVAKIVVSYTDAGESKTQEFTDFDTDGIIETSGYGEYTFTLVTYGKDGQTSSSAVFTVTNKGFIIEEVLQNAIVSQLEGEVEVRLLNNHGIPIKTTITYPGSSEPLFIEETSSDELITMTFPMQDGTHTYTVTLEDEQGRTTSEQYSYAFEYVVTYTISAQYGTGILTFSNNANSPIHLKVTYPLSGGGTTTMEQSYPGSSAVFNFVPVDGTHEVQVEYTDAAGRIDNRTITYIQNPYEYKVFSTAESKSAWSVTVSSNATNDGTGPTALLDGNSSTYWHTPWSGDIPPWPHYATITFDKEIQLNKLIIQIRHNNGNGSPKEFDLQVSSDGTNFTTHQTFTNTVNTAGATINFTVDPVATKYVRLLFRNNIANSSSMALAEISFEGNQEL